MMPINAHLALCKTTLGHLIYLFDRPDTIEELPQYVRREQEMWS